MKILHISDLHFGKSLCGRSLLDDQKDWCKKFFELVREVHPAAVLVAGDVYDRSAPSEDAVELLDWFLTELLAIDDKLRVMIVAGNHDSGSKLSFGSRIFEKQRLHIVGKLTKELVHVELEDEFGKVCFWLMPYTFPAAIRQVLGDESEDAFREYTDAVRHYLEEQPIDFRQRNVIVAHQSVTLDGKEAERGGSETMIGGVGGIDASVFDGFDYVALGHIHKGQHVGLETMRYAGSPLCYHFDETKYPKKGALCVELCAKGTVDVAVREIAPLFPLRVIKGEYEKIVAAEKDCPARHEFVKVILKDRKVNPGDAEALRALFLQKGSVALEIVSTFALPPPNQGVNPPPPERPLHEKFVDFWKSRHGDVEPDNATLALIEKAAEQVEMGSEDLTADAEALVKLALAEEK